MFRKRKPADLQHRNRVIVWCMAEGKVWLVNVAGLDLEEIECPSRVDAEFIARTIAHAVVLSGGIAQVRRKNKRGRFLPEWTYNNDPESTPG